MTPLDKTLKRVIRLKGQDFVVTLTPVGIKITRKGHRHGIEMTWESLLSGERALAVALQASLGEIEAGTVEPPAKVAKPTTNSAPSR